MDNRKRMMTVAETMLNIPELPESLSSALNRAYDMTESVGGSLVSRQAISAIIVSWSMVEELRSTL